MLLMVNIGLIRIRFERIVHSLVIIAVLSDVRLIPFSTLQDGWTPLIWAAGRGHADVVRLLLSAGANIEAADEVILMIHHCMAV